MGTVKQAARCLFGVPDFKYYALADGLHALFSRRGRKPHVTRRAPKVAQVYLWRFRIHTRHKDKDMEILPDVLVNPIAQRQGGASSFAG